MFTEPVLNNYNRSKVGRCELYLYITVWDFVYLICSLQNDYIPILPSKFGGSLNFLKRNLVEL